MPVCVFADMSISRSVRVAGVVGEGRQLRRPGARAGKSGDSKPPVCNPIDTKEFLPCMLQRIKSWNPR